MPNTSIFISKAPKIMQQLMDDFEIKDIHAAGILGNIGHECNGFNNLREIGQPEGKGGYGWAQWTGLRRKAFLDWCKTKNLQWQSDEGNYGFLKHELKTSYKATIAALLKTTMLASAVKAFERNYERAGVVNYESRNRWANIAIHAYKTSE